MDGLVIARQLKYESTRPLISLLYLQPIRNFSFALTKVECVSPGFSTKVIIFNQFLEIMYGKSFRQWHLQLQASFEISYDVTNDELYSCGQKNESQNLIINLHPLVF